MTSKPVSNKQLSFDNTEIAFKRLSDKRLKQAYWLFKSVKNNALVKVGTALTTFALRIGFPIKGLLKNTLFRQFCGGETLEECVTTADKLAKFGVRAILDYSVEGNEDEVSFDQTKKKLSKP